MQGGKNNILLPSLLTVPLLALVWALATRSPQSTGPHKGARSVRLLQQQPVYRSTAIERYRAYDGDPAAMRAHIGQRPIVVTGTVVAVSQDFLGRNLVLLDVGKGISTAAMTLAPDQSARAMQLRAGQRLSLACEAVQRYGDSPSGSNCTVTETRPGMLSLNPKERAAPVGSGAAPRP